MKKSLNKFLDIYRCAISGDKTGADIVLSGDKEWKVLLRLSELHHICPMVYETICASPLEETADTGFMKEFEEKAVTLTLRQARKTVAFLNLYQFLKERDLHPAVMKGIICRSLYPHPEQRYSTDEDLLIPGELFEQYHKAFLEYGLSVEDGQTDLTNSFEVSYCNKQIHIELHKMPFSPDSKVYGELNHFFANSLEHTVTQMIYGVEIHALGYTDHLFFLLCHCYKHFLNCGVGIRMISDIVLYSLQYCQEIDWGYIERCSREAGMFEFCCAVYRIGEVYLVPGRLPDSLKQLWLSSPVDEEPLLLDTVIGGVYGTSSIDRLHSSNITLGAKGREKSEGLSGVLNSTLLRTLFPSFRYMKQRYPYIKRFPILLPAGWIQRIGTYVFQSIVKRSDGNNASEALRIGNERVRLLQKYGILQKKKKEKPANRRRLYDRLKKKS